MSASLVGSEMCIRDSPRWPGRGSAKARAQLMGQSLGSARLWGGPNRSWGCLLYTSDAADDM
eukprot:9839485-Alexandrium_andersonii.AAC.1